MNRRNINPLIFPHTRIQNLFTNAGRRSPCVSTQFHGNTQENLHYVAQRLAWIGDKIEWRRASGHAGSIPRAVGRSLADAGDLLDFRYSPLARRNETLLRLLWRVFSENDDGVLAFAGALLQVCYLVLQQVSRNML